MKKINYSFYKVQQICKLISMQKRFLAVETNPYDFPERQTSNIMESP